MSILRSEMLARAGFHHAFPTRDATDTELFAELGTATVVQVMQVHGARAVLADEASGQEADAIVARGPAVAVGVRVADCVPVLVADEASGDVAAIHAGWRGVVAGVVRAGVELLGGSRPTGGCLLPEEAVGDFRRERAMARRAEEPYSRTATRSDDASATLSAKITRLLAAIGPCIGACCFEVGRDVGDQIGFVVHAAKDKAYVDLRAAVRAQLRALGLDSRRIEDVAGCTRHDAELFHSFRRDGANSGRMLAAIRARAR